MHSLRELVATLPQSSRDYSQACVRLAAMRAGVTMRNGPDRIASFTSLFCLGAALVACFLVLIFSWPEPREHRRAALSAPERCCDVVVGVAVIDGADLVPAAAQTGSVSRRSGVDR